MSISKSAGWPIMYRLNPPRLSPDGAGGGGASVSDPPDPEMIAKDEVERMIQGRTSKIKKENDRLKKEVEELRTKAAKVDVLEEKLDALAAKLAGEADPPPTDLQGQLSLMSSKHQKEVDGLKTQMEQEKQLRIQAEDRRKQVEKDRVITDALRSAKCREEALDMGKAYFQEKVVFDEDESRWIYNLKSGGTVEVIDGINEEIPDFLREATASRGGSGATGGGRKAAQQKEIEQEKATLEKLRERATASGKEGDIAIFTKQQRKVRQLEQKAAGT